MTEAYPGLTPLHDWLDSRVGGSVSALGGWDWRSAPLHDVARAPTAQAPCKILPDGRLYLYGADQLPGTPPTVDIHDGTGFVAAIINDFRYYNQWSLVLTADRLLIRLPAWRNPSNLRHYPFSRIECDAATGWAINRGALADASPIAAADPYQYDTATPATSGAPTVSGCLAMRTSLSSAIAHSWEVDQPNTTTLWSVRSRDNDSATGVYVWIDGEFALPNEAPATLAARFAWVSPSGKPSFFGIFIKKLPGLPVLRIQFGSPVTDGWQFTIAAGTLIRGDDSNAGSITVTINVRFMAYVDLVGPDFFVTAQDAAQPELATPLFSSREWPHLLATPYLRAKPMVVDVDGDDCIVQLNETDELGLSTELLAPNDGTTDDTDCTELPASGWIRGGVGASAVQRWSMDSGIFPFAAYDSATIDVTYYDEFSTEQTDSITVAGLAAFNAPIRCPSDPFFSLYNHDKRCWFPIYYANPGLGTLIDTTFAPVDPVHDESTRLDLFDNWFAAQQPRRQQAIAQVTDGGRTNPADMSDLDWTAGDLCQVFAFRVPGVLTDAGHHPVWRVYRPGRTHAADFAATIEPDDTDRWLGLYGSSTWDRTTVRGELFAQPTTGTTNSASFDFTDDSQTIFGQAVPLGYAPGFGGGDIVLMTSVYDLTSVPSLSNDGVDCDLWTVPALSEVWGTISDLGGGEPEYSFDAPWTLVESITLALEAIVVRDQDWDLWPDYDNTTAYVVGDKVRYEVVSGSGTTQLIYECILDSTGNIPTNATYWAEYNTGAGYQAAARYRGALTGHTAEVLQGYTVRLEFAANCHEPGHWNISGNSGWIAAWSEWLPRHPHTVGATGAATHYPGWIHDSEAAAADL